MTVFILAREACEAQEGCGVFSTSPPPLMVDLPARSTPEGLPACGARESATLAARWRVSMPAWRRWQPSPGPTASRVPPAGLTSVAAAASLLPPAPATRRISDRGQKTTPRYNPRSHKA
ncbi:hypothetical protein ATEIFO6365_0013022000 [Aspergillus terreus]|uniref:Uncharacterized protein n=1 Tax=Aspergillus terreus TaxID=33178 RepID=A0A5M3ZGC8_ASPTE|nr:hypothetical protein ATETN484_0014022000 [Aspergillus terreus]GFF20886.1 hypothetical protein ATEIFO6365_0013022000 [Aspergillus terreus]